MRYRFGLFENYRVYPLLFINHLFFALQVIPLLLLSRNWKAITERRYPHTREIISYSILAASFTLMTLATLSIIERGSVLLYVIYILLINFLVILPHRWRITFNLLSFLLILIAIISIHQDDYLNMTINIVEIIGISIPGFLVSTYRYNDSIRRFLIDKRVKEQKEIIEVERKKSDRLLLNILPAGIAQELKEKGNVQPRYHPHVAILFSDFQGFTPLSKTMTPEALVKELDTCFGAFDNIMAAHQLEKIKTIGDGYFSVGGIEEAGENATLRMIVAAKEMIDFIENRKVKNQKKGVPAFEIRIGVHCGPVVAGVVGKSKFTYDIWGSTVNLASRMETAGAPGKINISEDVFKIIKDHFPSKYRGVIEAKGIGEVKMYFVE